MWFRVNKWNKWDTFIFIYDYKRISISSPLLSVSWSSSTLTISSSSTKLANIFANCSPHEFNFVDILGFLHQVLLITIRSLTFEAPSIPLLKDIKFPTTENSTSPFAENKGIVKTWKWWIDLSLSFKFQSQSWSESRYQISIFKSLNLGLSIKYLTLKVSGKNNNHQGLGTGIDHQFLVSSQKLERWLEILMLQHQGGYLIKLEKENGRHFRFMDLMFVFLNSC